MTEQTVVTMPAPDWRAGVDHAITRVRDRGGSFVVVPSDGSAPVFVEAGR